jgi:hypothetical protein
LGRRCSCGAAFSVQDVANVGDEGRLKIPSGDDVAVVVVKLVGPANEVAAVLEPVIEDDSYLPGLSVLGPLKNLF